MTRSTSGEPAERDLRSSRMCFFGLMIIGSAVALGFAWPSWFSIGSFVLLPAAILCVVIVSRPLLLQRRVVRWYLIGAVALSVAELLTEFVWLSRVAR